MKITPYLFPLCFFLSQNTFAQQTISSLAEFIELQDASNQNIKMQPGTYHISSSSKSLFDGEDWRINVEGTWPGLFNFTGSNNTFDLSGVTFTFDSTIINEMRNLAHGNLVELGGSNNEWIGFNLQELPGDDGTYGVYINVSGGTVMQITGSGHEFQDLTVKARYSHPYGFGSIYGKTGSSAGSLPGSRLGKKSGLLLTELTDSTFDNVLVDHSAFGHTLFFNGPIDGVEMDNVTVIAESRSTNELRDNGIDGTDRNGVPFGLNYNGTILTGAADNNDFFNFFNTNNLDRCQSLGSGFQVGPIREDFQYSLAEGAFRGYTQDAIEGLIIRNVTVTGARSGIALDVAGPGLQVEGMTVRGIAGHGVPACDGAWNSANGGEGDATAYGVPSYAVVKAAQADAAYSTVLELSGDRTNVTADIEILDPENGYLRPSGSTALALISGSDHDLRLWKRDGNALAEDLVIKVGNNATSGLLLCNMTEQGVTLSNNVTNSTIYSIGDVSDSSNGSNTIIRVTDLSEEPNACSALRTTTITEPNSFIPDPNKTYYLDVPRHNLRLAATGESQDPYTTSTTATGADVEWKFVQNNNGYWHIQRAAGGSAPRLRTDNSLSADMQATTNAGAYTYYQFTQGATADTHFLTLPDGPSDFQRLQITTDGLVNFVPTSSMGSWVSWTITEASSSESIVHIRKRSGQDFAIDGGNGAANGQTVYLWGQNANNSNQQWIEIDRGNGYYSYQKQGTDHCIDGNNGGADRQDVYLWACADNNQNQHWQKVSTDSGFFQLVKRNASGFALNGGSGGVNGQNVNLFDSSNTSTNLQWSITPIN